MSVVLQTLGVNDVYEYNELHLDSAGRDAGTNNEPIFTISPSFDKVLGIKLLSAQVKLRRQSPLATPATTCPTFFPFFQIPFTYHVVNPTNNTFFYIDNGQEVAVTLPSGNYTIDNITPTLGQALATASATAALPGTFTVGYSAVSGKLHIQQDQNRPFSLRFGDVGNSGTDSPRLLLGFDAGIVHSDETGSMWAPNVVNITGPNYIYLSTSFGGTLSRYMRVDGANTSEAPVFAKIPVTVNPWQVIHYTDPSNGFAFDMSSGQLQHIELHLHSGHNAHALDMNGSPWSVVIQVLTQRDTSVARRWSGENGGSKRIRVR
jgi:hypothetical protein